MAWLWVCGKHLLKEVWDGKNLVGQVILAVLNYLVFRLLRAESTPSPDSYRDEGECMAHKKSHRVMSSAGGGAEEQGGGEPILDLFK